MELQLLGGVLMFFLGLYLLVRMALRVGARDFLIALVFLASVVGLTLCGVSQVLGAVS